MCYITQANELHDLCLFVTESSDSCRKFRESYHLGHLWVHILTIDFRSEPRWETSRMVMTELRSALGLRLDFAALPEIEGKGHWYVSSVNKLYDACSRILEDDYTSERNLGGHDCGSLRVDVLQKKPVLWKTSNQTMWQMIGCCQRNECKMANFSKIARYIAFIFSERLQW